MDSNLQLRFPVGCSPDLQLLPTEISCTVRLSWRRYVPRYILPAIDYSPRGSGKFFIGVFLGIVSEKPIRTRHLEKLGVLLDSIPICFVPCIPSLDSDFLGKGCSSVSRTDILLLASYFCMDMNRVRVKHT
jgi:hypothetical protein